MKWAIELSEFDIRYKPKTAIKGQVLADFVMEFTSAKPSESTQTTTDLPIWRLSVDGVAIAQGSGAELILTSPDGILSTRSDSDSKLPITRPNMKPS